MAFVNIVSCMEILEGVPELVSVGICEYRNSCNNEPVTRQFLPHANTASDGVPTAKMSYESIIESLSRIAVSFLPIRFGCEAWHCCVDR